MLAGALGAALIAGAPARAGTAPPCQSGGAACVVIRVLGAGGQIGPLHYASVDDVSGASADVTNATYSVPNSPGVTVDHGSSVRRLVATVADPSQVTYVEVDGSPGDGYGRHVLSTAELGPAGSNGFPGGLMPAIYADGGNPHVMNYVRPQRSDGDDQRADGPDLGLFSSAQDGAIELTVHLTGHPLDVSATATATDSTRRSFALSAQPTGASYSYLWHLPGGGTSADPAPTYTLPAGATAGTYVVAVAVDSADGSFGWGTTTVQVGAAPSPTPSPSQSGGTGGSGPGHHGPTLGPSGSSTSPDPHPTHGTGGTPSAPTATATPSPTASATPSATETTAPPAPSASATPTDTQPPTTAPAGDRVSGVLLVGAAPAGGAPPSADAPRATQAARPVTATSAGPVDPLVWGVLALVLLLLAGAGSESTAVRRWLVPRARRWLKMGP